MRILIAYDGSETSSCILSDLAIAGFPAQVECMVISVGELLQMGEPIDMETAKLTAFQACDYIRTHFPFWSVESYVEAGYPPKEILNLIDKWKADIVILGSHGYHILGRFLFGSVSHKVITSASCSVRVARKSFQDVSLKSKIIVGVDGSVQSIACIDAIIKRVWSKNSEVRLVTVVEHEKDENISKAQEIQSLLKVKLMESNFAVSSIIKSGDAKGVLLDEAKHWQANNIFVGSRGLGTLKRLLLGSVSMAVVEHAYCSVEVIHQNTKEIN